MRDLGLMGESTFSFWCADAGLIPNGSKIDKTGWDFFVEFPLNENTCDPIAIHDAAFECKVQVKATDKTDRKLPITLSNLRRLITAQMPAFFIFIEFDGANLAKRAYVVHIDNNLISKVLKKLHEIGQSDIGNNFNKRKMTIHYNNSHRMSELNGDCLKRLLTSHIGDNMAGYVAKKKAHLESTGFDNGFAQIHFNTVGEDNLKQLIDVSLGIEKQVNVSNFRGTHTRFGIVSKNPFIDAASGKLEMPNLKPHAEGFVRFKESKLSSGLSFRAKLYVSPFNIMVPDELRKMRVEGEFFDLKVNPYTGSISYSFSFGEGIRLAVRKFRDAIKLVNLLSSSGKRHYIELDFDGYPKLEFEGCCKEQDFDLSKELKTLESVVNIVSRFDIIEEVDISFSEIVRYRTKICQFEDMLNSSPNLFMVEFSVDSSEYDNSKETACIFLVTSPIGSHILGVVLVLTGKVEKIEGEQFRLITKEAVIEKKIASERDETIKKEDLIAEIEDVEEKYGNNYSVVTMFDKSAKNEC